MASRVTLCIRDPLALRTHVRRGDKTHKTVQTFTSAHASIHNHFNQDRLLNKRATLNDNRSAAVAEWRELAA
jgi:putative transposase